MINFYKQVCDFHKAFDLPLRSEPDKLVFDDKKLCKLRFDLIKEEIGELNDAINTRDFIEIIDALSDIMYVVYGCGASFGIDLNESFMNMLCCNYNIYNLHDFGFKKNNYSHFDIVVKYSRTVNKLTPELNVFDNVDMMEQLNKYTDKFKYYINKLKKYIYLLPNMKEIENVLNNILKNVFDIGVFLGIDLNKSYNIVHESNITKLCKTEKEAIETVEWYKNNEKRYDTPSYKKSKNGTDWIIYNESSDKILKSINYKVANFQSML